MLEFGKARVLGERCQQRLTVTARQQRPTRAIASKFAGNPVETFSRRTQRSIRVKRKKAGWNNDSWRSSTGFSEFNAIALSASVGAQVTVEPLAGIARPNSRFTEFEHPQH